MHILKKCFKWSMYLAGALLIFVFALYGYAKMSPKLEIKSANAFMMYDSSNQLFFQGSGTQEWVSLNDISQHVIDATIVTEDKKFYQHHGFDFLRILKALYVNFTTQSRKEGASTISQQYAKNLFLDFDKTWSRKIEEMWLTIQLEVHYDKDEILEGYLNTINYGHGMYGIENASQFYFGKHAKDLSIAEAAMLVGIPKSPSNYSPLVNLEVATNRQQYILLNMKNAGVISEEEYEQAKIEPLHFIGEKEHEQLSTIMYYQDAVMRELESIEEIPSSYLETGGIRIYTSLQMDAQTKLEKAIRDNMPDSDLQVASVMMEPNTGRIIALVGGRDYNTSQFNRAVQSKRQVGSTMKPFLYYAALENGFTASTTFTSQETTFTFSNNQTYTPQNYGGTYGNQPISLATAIAYSDNIYAVKTHMFLGEDVLVEMAKRVGITADLQTVPSLPLGTAEINIMEMAGGYAAFANNGYRVEPHLILRVEDLSGNVIYEKKEVKTQVLNSSLTFIMDELLTTTYDATFIDYNYPTAINLQSRLTKKYALKSGTTNTDHWSIGYNPDVVTAVWCGYDDNHDLEATDYKYSRNIWADSMESFLEGKEEHWYEIPNNVVGMIVNPITGKPATASDTKRKLMYYIKGTEPTGEETVFENTEN